MIECTFRKRVKSMGLFDFFSGEDCIATRKIGYIELYGLIREVDFPCGKPIYEAGDISFPASGRQRIVITIYGRKIKIRSLSHIRLFDAQRRVERENIIKTVSAIVADRLARNGLLKKG